MPPFTGFQRATVNLKQGTGAVAERRKTQARHLVRARQAIISRHLKKCLKIVEDRLVELDKMGSIN
ncbi:hypothetical protein [Pantoea ananatis]|nr:hypothetical protein [Pantoea ananatis]KTR71759.1 hypothetical protein NS296_06195 [Pantoea ananatis]PZD65219.1 hypothetical protein ARC272_07710 [Pantoea ananatis]UYK92198.1 hypothetical protein NG826_16935 [Pantoea ananatis]